MEKDAYDFIFGVFNEDKLVFAINRVTCSHNMAQLIVGILDLAKEALRPGDYFAYDYYDNVF